jgi:hypothetical protein
MLCDDLGMFGKALKVAITIGFFAMARQSNLAPRAAKNFDPSRHTCRADVVLEAPGLILLLKWSKTCQSMQQPDIIPIPHVPGSPADPVAAYKDLLRAQPTGHPNQPLLSLPSKKGTILTITSRQLAEALRELIIALELDPHMYSLHSLRRGGASTAYQAGVHFNDIKRHGQWKSDAFWLYITSPSVASSPVAAALGASAAALQ